MTLDDLAGCEAEVIEPIKYEFRAGKAGESGVSLWEVSFTSCNVILYCLRETLTEVPAQRSGFDRARRSRYH